MDRWGCPVCGYIYNPTRGDPANRIVPGTSFEELPDDWKCPTCEAAKEQFEPSGQ
nr:MAG: rubredoxin [Candidatus Thorarchaeota archaeon SMTZ1-83]